MESDVASNWSDDDGKVKMEELKTFLTEQIAIKRAQEATIKD